MPLNKTGKKIMKSMKDQYGSKEGEQVFYASKNKGILPKVEKASMGKSFGPPPKRGPQPQGMKKGDMVNMSCPYRENGLQGSVIKGVKPIQVKGTKFIGVK